MLINLTPEKLCEMLECELNIAAIEENRARFNKIIQLWRKQLERVIARREKPTLTQK